MWKTELKESLFSNDPSKIDAKKAIKIKYENLPQYLYKYGAFDKEYYLELLEEDKQFLSNPSDFNDPFDSVMATDFEHAKEAALADLDNFLKKMKLYISPNEKELLKSSKDFYHDLSELMVKKKGIPPEDFDEVVKKVKETFKGNLLVVENPGLFIACYSEMNDSILMWSHYSKNHEGYCIKYDFKELGIESYKTCMLFPVMYDPKIFNMHELDSCAGKKFKDVLFSYLDEMDSYFEMTTIIRKEANDVEFNNMIYCYASLNKSEDWEYEKEWRYVVPFGNAHKPQYLITPKPKAVYLGAKINQKNKSKILDIAKKRNFEVHQMKMNSNDYRLESTRIL